MGGSVPGCVLFSCLICVRSVVCAMVPTMSPMVSTVKNTKVNQKALPKCLGAKFRTAMAQKIMASSLIAKLFRSRIRPRHWPMKTLVNIL